MLFVVVIMMFAFNHMFENIESPFGSIALDFPNPLGTFVFAIIVAPMWEEIKYRVLPILISKHYAPNLVWPIVLVASIDFGLGHGHVANILVQGVGGVILSYVYIKNGYSYISSALTHCLYNLSLMYLLPYIFH